MNERSEEILEAAIKEFIRTGEPISSSQLFANYGFGIKPAMIRLELCELEREGYLAQPYHSAGRIPTDLGYKFFTDRALQKVRGDSHVESWERMLANQSLDEFLEDFSRRMGLVTALVSESFEDTRKNGLKYLFENLEEDSHDRLSEVIYDIEELSARVREARRLRALQNFMEVFIGKESPITKSELLSVTAADFDSGGERYYLFAIGPKRMNYEKTISALKGLKSKNKINKNNGRQK
jgi:transcriptional regulator of heat shock response